MKYDKWGDIVSSRDGLFKLGKFIEGTVNEIISSKNADDLRNGCTYTGGFKDGNYNGKGVLSDNQYDYTIEGKFVNGYPVEGSISANNYLYEGEIHPYTFYPHGKGVERNDGNKSEGVFYFGVLIK